MKRAKLVENKVLGRKEVRYIFENASGKLSRVEAAKMVASDLGVEVSQVFVLNLDASHGTSDVEGTFYVYDDPKLANVQLQKYIFLRNLTKDERKKILDEMKKKKAPKVAAQKK